MIQLHGGIDNAIQYGAYLIRFWRDTPVDDWRASAQSVQNGETVRFGSVQDLFVFLEKEINSGNAVDPSQE